MALSLLIKGLVKTLFFVNLSKFGRRFLCTQKRLMISKTPCITPWFSSFDQAEKFKKYLSSKHPNINFSLVKENDAPLSFLDINIFRGKGNFVTNVYRK